MRALKVCLVNPPHPYLINPDAQAPLGLLYVASAIRESGNLVDFINLSADRNLEKSKIPEADLYGITGTALDLPRIHDVALEIRSRYADSIIVVGGPIGLSAEKLDRELIDTVVFGEGEREFLKVIGDFPHCKEEYRAERIFDLDNLAFPARDLLSGNLGGDVFADRQRFYGEKSTVISTSRGCPCICTFCASPKIWNRKIVYRSAESIVEEMQYVVDVYNVRQFRFSDDNLTCDRSKLETMCKYLQGQKIAWRASIRVIPNDVEMFKMMKSAGCVEVCFGIESGDPDVLRALKKGAGVNDNRRAIINAHSAGLIVRILFMIGTPGESLQTVNRNIEFFESVKNYYDTIALTNFTPLPGCAIADDVEGNGCQKYDEWRLEDFNLCMWGPDGQNKWKNFIIPNGLTDEELSENKKRMIQYVVGTGKSNRG